MIQKIRHKGDLEGALLVKRDYPDIYKSFEYNGRTLRDVAKLIKEDKLRRSILQDRSIETIVHYLSIYFKGGEYDNVYLEPKIEDYEEIVMKKRKNKALENLKDINGFENWQPNELEFIIKGYKKNYSLKKIFKAYSSVIERKGFNIRSYDSISSKLDSLRKDKIIGKQRIDWDGDVGFFALYLLERYGKNFQFLKRNANCLDDYFFDSKGILNREKLNNFYRRAKRKLK